MSAINWVNGLKSGIAKLLDRICIQNPPKLGLQFKKTGIDNGLEELPLLEEQALFPKIRIETIHKVKGESIEGVLVIGSKGFFDSVANDVIAGNDTEDRRLCYVAATRAKHLLVLAPPKGHLDKFGSFWTERGFA
ncbi:MAG: 3'-5' exonuclease [Verrucomicrobiia bacterium]